MAKSSSSSVAAAALPGIHEVLSKRQHQLPSFANLMPAVTATAGCAPKSSMQLSDIGRYNQTAVSSASVTSSPAVCLSGVVNPTQRPTAQLPPMTHGLVRFALLLLSAQL